MPPVPATEGEGCSLADTPAFNPQAALAICCTEIALSVVAWQQNAQRNDAVPTSFSALALPLAERDSRTGDTEGVMSEVEVAVTSTDAEADCERAAVMELDGADVVLVLCVAPMLALAVMVQVTDAATLSVAVPDEERSADIEADHEYDGLHVMDLEVVAVRVALALPVLGVDGELVIDALSDTDTDAVAVDVIDREPDSDTDDE